ncbi:MAG: class I SAM-dependent methyltransferase [Actinomycetota bacterium]|nr:class I SAM-dependent methyltransferase [Actinomycetota bacterium]
MADRERETYTPGHEDYVLEFMERRSAESHAAWFLPLLEPGLDLLDCACGPGSITVGLAESVVPGQVTGIDLHADQLERAREIARAHGIDNLEFQEADIYNLPFADGSFDRIFSNALLEHLSEPIAALREMKRVLRPRGVVGVAAPDWDGFIFAPSGRGAEEAVTLYQLVQRKNGGNPLVGRELGTLLEAGGFRDVTLGARYEVYEETPYIANYVATRLELSAETDADAGDPALTPERFRKVASDLRSWGDIPHAMWAQTWIHAIARV